MTDSAAASTARAADRSNPYVGPRAFQYGERIYGRSRETAELRDIMIARRIVLLYSPSGAGKSSLIEAGLRTELAEAGFRLFPTIRIGAEPPDELDGVPVRNRYVLSTLLSLEESQPAGPELKTAGLATIRLGDFFDLLTADDESGSEPCFVFDQFEELFTLDPTDVDAKRDFLAELGVALRDKSRWALFAMREDFIAQLDPYLGLIPSRLASRYRLDLLEPAAAKAAAQRPAADREVTFSDAAADRLTDDLRRVRVQRGAVATDELGPHVEPVQLQVVCRQLWSGLDPAAASIDVEDVAALGNVDDALADFYEAELTAVTERTGVSEREIRTWFDAELITPDGFRTQVLDGPGAAGAAVLRELENAHLIRADRRRGTEWYELSHDRLVQPIQTSNARWLDEHLTPLQREAQTWEARSRPAGLLITGEVLAEAEEWARTHDAELLAVDREYLEACQAEQRRVDLERKVARRNRVLAVVATTVGILALAGLLFANNLRARAARDRDRATQERDRAEQALRQRDEAEAARAQLNASNAWLAAGAQADEPRDQVLAWQAAFRANPDNRSADLARKLTTAQHYLAHDAAYVATARALHPTGRTVARGTTDGRVEIVDVDTLQRQLLVDLDDPIEGVAFNSAGDVVAVAAGSSVTLWKDGDQIAELTSPELGKGFGVELSLAGGPNDLVAAVVHDDATSFYGRLVLWQGGTEIASPLDPEVRAAKALVAGSRLAAITGEGLRVWGAAGSGWDEVVVDHDLVPPDRPAVAPYAGLTWSADGNLLAASTADGLKVYTVGSPAPPTSQPADVQGDDKFTTLTAIALPTASTMRTVDELGHTSTWELALSGAWQRSDGPTLPASFQAQMSIDGSRTVTGDRNTFAVYDTPTASQLLGQFAAGGGSTGAGRSVVVRQPGAVDEQSSGGGPWRRGPVEGAVDAAVSASGLAMARLLVPSGSVVISSEGGTTTSPCPLTADGGWPDATQATLATADAGIAVASVDLPDGQLGDMAFSDLGASQLCVVGSPAFDGIPTVTGDRFNAVDISADADLSVLGISSNGAGFVELTSVPGLSPAGFEAMTRPVTAVALSTDAEPTVAAGDDQGNLLIFESGPFKDDPAADVPRCTVSVPTPMPIVAIAVGQGSDGQRLVAAATSKAVYTYRVDVTAEPCTNLTGGLDLLRDEGEVLDVAVGSDGSVTVLESDLNVFTFDPATPPADVSDDVKQRVDSRGWALSAAECEAAVDQPCPA